MSMIIKLVVLVAILATSFAATSTFHANCGKHFSLFQKRFIKRYGSDDVLAKRRGIFCENMKKVDALNALNGLNGLIDWVVSDLDFTTCKALLAELLRILLADDVKFTGLFIDGIVEEK